MHTGLLSHINSKMKKKLLVSLLVAFSMASCVRSLEDEGVMDWDSSSLKLPQMLYNGQIYYIHPDAGEMSYEEAIDYCKQLTAYSHSDWFLPNKAELTAMFNNDSHIGGFTSAAYWYENPYTSNDTERSSYYNGGALSAGKARVRPVRCDNAFTPILQLKQIHEGNWSSFEITIPKSSRYTVKTAGLCCSEEADSKSAIRIVESSYKEGTFVATVDRAILPLKTRYLRAYCDLADGRTIYSNELTLIPHKPEVDFILKRKDRTTITAVIDIKDWGFPQNFQYVDVRLTDDANSYPATEKIEVKEDVYHYEKDWTMDDGTLYLMFNPYGQGQSNASATFSANIAKDNMAPQVKTLAVSDKTAIGLDMNTNIIYSMTVNGELIDLGYPEATMCGLVISSVNTLPTIENNEHRYSLESSWSKKLETGRFSFSDIQVTPSGSIYVRAYATNDKETIYGNVVEVKFVEPEVSAVTVANITSSSAVFSSSISETGDPVYQERGFVYLPKYLYSDKADVFDKYKHSLPIPNNNIIGTWTMNANGLLGGTEYVVYSYVAEGGIYWRSAKQYFTTIEEPYVKTQPVTWAEISKFSYKVTFHGEITNQNKTQYVERGFIIGHIGRHPEDSGNSILSVADTDLESLFSLTFDKYFSSDRLQYDYVWAYAKTSDGKYYYGDSVLF